MEYLKGLTPVQKIEILEYEIKLNEEKVKFYSNSPLYSDQLKQTIDIKRYNERINQKQSQINKLKKQL